LKPAKKISIAVGKFAVPAPRKGSIETHSGLGKAQVLGIEIHQKLQAERAKNHPGYKSEVMTSHSFEKEGYQFLVSGKMDGIFAGTQVKIEEIKSAFNIYDLLRRLKETGDEHPYCLQLRTYGYFHWLKAHEVPELCLHLVSTRNGEAIDYKVNLDVEAYEKWMELRLQELVEESKLSEKRAERRKRAASNLQFPFERPRASQLELIGMIEEGMRENRPMLIQAPTGLGKTVGVLYPTLRESLSRGQRSLYVTPKNSQHAVAEDAIERLQEYGANIKAMTLTAKSKMCFKNEPLCNPEYCEFAKDHYTKVADNKLIEKLGKKKNLTARVFKKMAADHQVCPFELQLDASAEADAIICDYNYVFAPRSALSRLSGDIENKDKPNLIIDEAHNLPSRAMDYYSPALSVFTLEKMRVDAEKIPYRFRNQVQNLISDCIRVVQSCKPQGESKACKITPPVRSFVEQDSVLRQFLSEYLNSDVEILAKDVVLRFCFYWAEFTEALEFVQGDSRPAFFTTFVPNPAQVKITCCDASSMLKESYKDYSQVVGFSATLKPFDFYSQLSGLSDIRLKTAEFTSPFCKAKRKILIIPQLSSKYSERERNYPRIADAITRIAAQKSGNYFAFFPSFEFMNRVIGEFAAPSGFQILRQESGMSRDAINEVLEIMKESPEPHIVFAVQGGVFSEGVDYPGKMVIGAFIVGPPLPNFDLVREEMRKYYEENYSAGFDYAYTFPAMAKAVQAAGRVIRSEEDRGLIVLMDSRFTHPSYTKSMPQDWFEKDPSELISQNILKDIAKFWTDTDVAKT
jgi:DNA excision repair protein ERCC-2